MTSQAADDEFVIVDHRENVEGSNDHTNEGVVESNDESRPPFSVIISSAEPEPATISLLHSDSSHPMTNAVSPTTTNTDAALPASTSSSLTPNPRLYAPRPSRSRKGSSHDAWSSAYVFAQNEAGGKAIKESLDLVFPYTPPPIGAGRSLSPLPGVHGRKVSSMPLQPHEHPLYDKMKVYLRGGLTVGQRSSVYKRLLALYGDARLEVFESDYSDWRSETFQGMELTIQAFPSLPTFGSTVKWNNFGVPFNSIGVLQSAPSAAKEEPETAGEEIEPIHPTSADDGERKEKPDDPLSRFHRRSSLALRRFAVPYEFSHATKLILCVVSHLSPDVTYCPLILDLIVYFLSIGATENQTFALVYTMIKRSLKDEYWMPLVPKSWSKMIHCMAALIEKKDSSLYQFMTKDLRVDVKRDLIDPWIRRLFVSFLPLPAVIRLMDCWLLEGSKVFYRILLAIFKIHRTQIMKCDPSEQKPLDYINALLSHTPTELLIKTAFDIFLQRKELVKITSSIDHLSYLPSASPIFHIPRFIDGSSDILNRDLCFQIWSWLPQDIRIRDPQLIYSSSRHGYRFNTMAQKGAGLSHPLLMIIKAGTGSVVGAFIPAAWTLPLASLPLNLDGRSFVFTLAPHRKVFRHVKYGVRRSTNNLQDLISDSEDENDQTEGSELQVPSTAPPAPNSPKSPPVSPPPVRMHKSVKLSPLVEADEDFKEAGVTSNDLAALRNKLLAGKPRHDQKEDPLANLLAVAGTLKGVQLTGKDMDKLHAHTWSGAVQQNKQRNSSTDFVGEVHHKMSGDTFTLPSLKRADTGLFETFMMINDQFFAIGDSSGFALSFDKEMKVINSAPTAGFRSPTLLNKRTHRLTASSADASVAALTSNSAINFALGMTSQPAESVTLPIIDLELWSFAIPSH